MTNETTTLRSEAAPVETTNVIVVKPTIVTLTEKELKANIEKVILESFNKAKQNKFRDLEFYFLEKKSELKTLKEKLAIFNSLDMYSKTFLSIHIKTKAALREFCTNKFEEEYLELLRLVLTLSDRFIGKKLKSIKTRSKEPIDLNTLKPQTPEQIKAVEILKTIHTLRIAEKPISEIKLSSDKEKPKNLKSKYNIEDNTLILQENITGKDVNKRFKKSKQLIKDLDNLNL